MSRRYYTPFLELRRSGVTIRAGDERDLERIAEIKVRSWKATYGPLIRPDVLRRFVDPNGSLDGLRKSTAAPDAILLVAEAGPGNVVGFSLAFLDRPPEPWLESLHVLSDFQGRGAGTLLMRATAAEIQRRGGASMRLGVVEGNTQAERFYERLGGRSAGLEPADFDASVRHHVYRWPDLEALA